jgi:hypothetical protein
LPLPIAFLIDTQELKPGLVIFRRADVKHRNWYCRVKLPSEGPLDEIESNLAKRRKTSRTQLDRLLDADNESVTLGSLTRAARAVGRHLRMELV